MWQVLKKKTTNNHYKRRAHKRRQQPTNSSKLIAVVVDDRRVALKRASVGQAAAAAGSVNCLTSETVECAALSLERVDNVHGGDSLPLGVLGVGDCIADDVLEEDLQHAASLLVDQARDTLHTSTSRQTANGWLGDALDVVSQHLPVALGTALSQSLASFSSSRHIVASIVCCRC